MSSRKRNLTLDWVKLIASYFVVAIHLYLPGRLGPEADCVARLSVPFFFVISGYYALGSDHKSVGRKLHRTIRLALLSNLFYFFLGFLIQNYTGYIGIRDYFFSKITLYSLSLLLLTGSPPTDGFHLWFLSALVFCYAILYLYVRFFDGKPVKYQHLYCVSFCLMAGFIYADSLTGLIAPLGSSEPYRNGLFMGLPCFSMGLFLREHQERIIRLFSWNNLRSLILFAAGIGMSLMQWTGTGKAEMPVGMLLAVPALLLFCVQNPTPPHKKPTSLLIFWAPLAGNLSLLVYLLHISVYRVASTLQNTIPLFRWMLSEESPFPVTIWVILLTTLVGLMLCAINKGFFVLRQHTD